eukprot:snap_masked-scaffold308_size214241-processed-gene-0.0 protein:Tk09047 transcript:snap_masked-scaffold308_size214241-processed-gene-0.0-mRNA-1 annotation:"solute carrier family 41 member 2"
MNPMDEDNLSFELIGDVESTNAVMVALSGSSSSNGSDVESLDDDRAHLIGKDPPRNIIEDFDIETLVQPSEESCSSITLQVLFPFLVAGLGMVAAGLVLDIVQHWPVFVQVSELFILVPALLGLKGNLEMTLASRLSTQANLGNMDTKEAMWSMVYSNLALVQCQAIVVGLVAAFFAMVTGWLPEGRFSFDHGLLLCASSILTASIASFILGIVMVVVILLSRRCSINPDNVATPIAASLGDLTTLVLLSVTASALFADLEKDKWLAPVIIAGYILIVPLFIWLAKQNVQTEKVLYHGWTPVLCAMMISSVGGLILDQAISRFDGIAVFQPVMNGVGGNLAAVQASRLSTSLHKSSNLGCLPNPQGRVCPSPWAVFQGSEDHAKSARILMSMVVPGHLVFILCITLLEAGHTQTSPVFFILYLLAALIQVWILLHTAQWMILLMWKRGTDPDSAAIPYLTALGDLMGGTLLWGSFEILALSDGQGRTSLP